MATRVDIRRATDLARMLGEFTRKEFAEALGVTPLDAGKWLRRLQDEKDTIRREGAKYVFDDPEQREAPPPPPYEGMDPRVVARKLRTFSAQELAAATGLREGTAHNRCHWLMDLDVIRDSGKRTWPGKAVIYEVVEVEKQTVNRSKRKPVEVEMRDKGMIEHRSNGRHHEKRIKAQKQGIQPIIDAAYEAGATIRESGKHYVITLPGGAKLTVTKTPGTDKPKKEYAEARRLGLNV